MTSVKLANKSFNLSPFPLGEFVPAKRFFLCWHRIYGRNKTLYGALTRWGYTKRTLLYMIHTAPS